MARVAVEYRMTSKDTYKRFCADNPKLNLTYTEWCNIIYTFNYNFRDYILETGDRVKLSHGLGDFAISKKRPKRTAVLPDGTEKIVLPVNWKKTKEHGRYIYHLNPHTEGYRFKWRWWSHTARFYRSDIWNFKPSRVSSRMLTHYINQGPQYHHKYKEWELVKY